MPPTANAYKFNIPRHEPRHSFRLFTKPTRRPDWTAAVPQHAAATILTITSVTVFGHPMLSAQAGFGVSAAVNRTPPQDSLAREFDVLADEWHAHTDHFSVTWRQAIHPAYQQIIGMGDVAVPFILRRLRQEGTSWLWALRAIARKDAAEGVTDWDKTVDAWEGWARTRGLI